MRLRCIGLLCTLNVLLSCAYCQETSKEAPETNERSQPLFDRFEKTAESIDVTSAKSDDAYALIKTPLFRFSSEGNVFGSVYLWMDAAQRLAVVGTIGSIPIRGVDVEFIELHLLSPDPIKPIDLPGTQAKRWAPNVSELPLRPVPDAPDVAKTERARLVQMRTLARQFSATMVEGDRTNQLRLLPQPLYRYEGSTAQRDGGLFAFIWDKGTDPELLLRLEVSGDDNATVWSYQPVRFTWRELNLRHKMTDVYHVDEFTERDNPVQTTPYVTGLTSEIP